MARKDSQKRRPSWQREELSMSGRIDEFIAQLRAGSPEARKVVDDLKANSGSAVGIPNPYTGPSDVDGLIGVD